VGVISIPTQFKGTMMVQADIKTKTNIELREPPLYKVIYINDNQTAIDFVINSLVEHFDYTPVTAERITIDIHESGAAVVAVLPYEIAEQKGIEVTVSARSEGYPLQIKLEPDVA
jgi:ATP-dependent Clp protease adaptor protein ClpS